MVSTQTPNRSTGPLPGFDPQVHIFIDRCAGCQECIIRCPTGALTLDTQKWVATVDNSLCVGCRQCVRTCPFSAISVEGSLVVAPQMLHDHQEPDLLLGNVEEVREGFQSFQEMTLAAQRCIQCPDPTCVRGCPAHNDIPGFIKAALSGDLDQARELLSLTTCLPGACSRVCDWGTQCEGSCSWTLAGGDPVEIGKIERYIADNSATPKLTSPSSARTRINVAVIGSGPGGLGAAYELSKRNVKVTVFEADSGPGGIMRWGIPTYVLPDKAWVPLVDELKRAGVEFHFDSPVNPESVGMLVDNYDAVLLAAGAEQPILPRVGGLELSGIEDANEFLKMAKAALMTDNCQPILSGKKVLVLGAGNTAMDVARSVLRLGGHPTAIDWMDERFSRARPDEIAEARKEGVDVRFLTTVSRFFGDESGHVESAELLTTTQKSATSMPIVKDDTSEWFDVDLVVLAMGYRVDSQWTALSNSVKLGTMPKSEGLVDRHWLASGLFAGQGAVATLAYDREKVRVESAFPIQNRIWAVGDLRVGPSTVVSSMAQGMSAARGILAEMEKASSLHGYRSLEIPNMYLGSVLIVHDGASENVKKASEYMSRVFWGRGWEVEVINASKLDPQAILGADLLIYGSQVEGLILGDVHPSRKAMTQLKALPPLCGQRVATFVVHALTPRDAGKKLREQFVNKGADVITSGEIYTKHLIEQSKKFALETAQILDRDLSIEELKNKLLQDNGPK